MAQPTKHNVKKVVTIKAKGKKVVDKRLPPKQKKERVFRKKPINKEYGTSKLEFPFAKEFLDKLGIEYIYQYKAEEIGRYFDFFCPQEHVIIEIDGDYW